ncbi:nitrate reductase subunit alpha [bacterium]|nr:MAG: nitrate reductase subunit alpha [bacterium]RIK61736.1 MAG: nitrate reductase subunit alpha [Planctomycetota bacterium]
MSSWIQDIVDPETRSWEEFYRNRWSHDKVIRSTHGVNCTGSCGWMVYVKDGIVTWEMQALDYLPLAGEIPPYEPRGCQRGISYSWYLYSPLRVKYPYIRGALLDAWKAAKGRHSDSVEAWASIQNDAELRRGYQKARGKGGFRRTTWATVLDIMAAANIHTAKTWGPDRINGFSPIPAMSMVSYAAGARFLQLMGGVSLSFYDWYCDLPPASPEIWGEQTDVNESADWYNAKFIAIMGSNLNMTRTPDAHFAVEARHNGTKVVVFAPDFNQVSKFADEWVPIHAGQDGAFWMSVVHVILKEYFVDKQVPRFVDYNKRFTDNPLLVRLEKQGDVLRPGRLLRANTVDKYKAEDKGEWKFLLWDKHSGQPRMPMGFIGHRWQEKKGQWNLLLKDGVDGQDLDPLLSLAEIKDGVLQVGFDDFVKGKQVMRGVPVKYVQTSEGKVPVCTVFDLLLAQYGVDRGLGGEYAKNYEDAEAPYTPAWQEMRTGIGRQQVIRFARDWARTAELTGGKCTVIIGAGIDHWYHNNLIYRAAINAMLLCGCVGVNGGGLAHYVGQEKLAPGEPWAAIALGRDWNPAARLQNAPSWHYIHTDQWRYEKNFTDYHTVPTVQPANSLAKGHAADVNVTAVRNGWLPFYPQFNKSSVKLVQEAEAAGAKTDKEVIEYAVRQLKEKKLKFSIEDPDAPENWPRVWYIWRGNALMSSAKGHEFFLKHYLGTHTNAIAQETVAKGAVREIAWHETAPQGKMDLIVDLNFRMDTSALYSDIVLPAATWYEKADLNTTDMHAYVNPLSAAVPPCWESKSDWDIFKAIAKETSELAKKHIPQPLRDLYSGPLQHDSAAELAQPRIPDWISGKDEAVPGKTMPNMTVIARDFVNLHARYCAFGPLVRDKGLGAHGTHYKCDDLYDEFTKSPFRRTQTIDGRKFPSIERAEEACDIILNFASVTNGEMAWRGYKEMEERCGVPLTHLADASRGVRMNYNDIQSQPRRQHNSAMWSGLPSNGRAYAPFVYNIENNVPFRTLTGRQHYYLDHEGYLQFGEHLCTYKPRPTPMSYGDLVYSEKDENTLMLNYLTPHGKWHIHSTYGDNERMTTLSRGCEPFWMNPKDAEKLGIKDNDWLEIHNDNGVLVTRANVSARIPEGLCIVYHSPERTYGVPKSQLRGGKRGGGHNSLTRVRLKPTLMVGGYGQFTYHFNYWGPTGVNRDTHVLVRKLGKLEW